MTASISHTHHGFRFPEVPGFTGFDRPTRLEANIFELEVSGEVPHSLCGSWYRLVPEPQFLPNPGGELFLNGDGMVNLFRFTNGHVDFLSRYVRTEKFVVERAARRSLFGAYRNPFTDDFSVRGLNRGTANTTPLWHGGRLFALKEDSPPVELDPLTLETRGTWTYDGQLKSRTATAHPKIDPVTGELFFFGYAAKGETTRDIAFYVADAGGRIIREEWFEAPYPALIHDFVVTREHIVFPIMPTTTDLDRLKRGGSHWLWDPTLTTRVGIFPRAGTVSDIRWFEGPPRFGFHYFNGFTEGGTVVVDGCIAEAQPFPFFYPDTRGEPFNPSKAAPRITRWKFDLDKPTTGFSEQVLYPHYADLPRIDDRFAMGNHRYGFVIANVPERDRIGGGIYGFNTLVRYDFYNNDCQEFSFDAPVTFQEPVFVPRLPGAPEGDGYLLMLANRYDTMLSDLVIFDTRTLSRGPIAEVKLPIRLRNGVHGAWIPQHLLPAGQAV